MSHPLLAHAKGLGDLELRRPRRVPADEGPHAEVVHLGPDPPGALAEATEQAGGHRAAPNAHQAVVAVVGALRDELGEGVVRGAVRLVPVGQGHVDPPGHCSSTPVPAAAVRRIERSFAEKPPEGPSHLASAPTILCWVL